MTITPYAPRSIRFLELWRHEGWTVKLYGISAVAQRPSPAIVTAAQMAMAGRLPRPAVSADRYGAAFGIVHEARGGNYVLLDWWVDDNALQHHVYRSAPEDPGTLEYISPTGLAVCVWELAVLGFERAAWIDCVLKRSESPDLGEYFARTLNADL